MHILFLTQGYPTSINPIRGIFFRDQAEILQKKGNKVGVIAILPVSIKDLIGINLFKLENSFRKINGVTTIIYSYINIPKFPKYCVNISVKKGLEKFEQYIKNNGIPDILHVQRYESGLLAIAIKEKYNVPFVVTEHSTLFYRNAIPTKMREIAKNVFESSNKNFAVSTEFVKLLSKEYNTPFTYLPNLVDTDQFTINDKFKNSEKFVFFNAAQLSHKKNHKMMIEAFYKLTKNYNNIELRIAGSGEEEKALIHLVRKYNIHDKVIFLGGLNRAQIIKEFQKANVFLLPSLVETFGVVVIEAMSCGLPVIATKCGGPESIIKNDKLGYLVDVDFDSFFEAMRRIYDNYCEFDSDFIREYVIDNFSGDSFSKKINLVYKEILNK